MKRALTILGLVMCGAGCSGADDKPAKMDDTSPSSSPTSPPPPAPDLFSQVPDRVPTASGKGGAASTVDLRATLAAIEVLKKEGNAVDAAVAAASVLGVTDPFSCGIGGGGFMIIYMAGEKRLLTIDNRETTPAAMKRTAFYDETGVVIPFKELVTSGLSVGVPGTVRGWDEALHRFGKLGKQSLEPILARAIWLAEEGGFDVDQTFFDQTGRNVDRFHAFTSTSKVYLTQDGKPWPVGTIFKNPDLGKTYRLLAKGGADAFYDGEVAAAIVDTVKHPPLAEGATLKVRPGVMEQSDLIGYQARVRPAVQSSYRGYTIYGMGMPSSGGTTIAMALNLLSGYDLKALSSAGDTAGVLHRYIGASRLAFADRGAFMGDPEYVSVPVEGLLSEGYTTERRALIDLMVAPAVAALPGNPSAYQMDPSSAAPPGPKGQNITGDTADLSDILDRETTHITVTDKDGNIVAYTCTIEQEGGSGMVVPGYGFFLNNELTDFNTPADVNTPHPNVLEPGKRPRSSISPTLVFKDGVPELALGSPGGATIITTVLQTLVNYIDLGMPIDKALAAPRISQRNSGTGASDAETAFLKTKEGAATPEATALTALGHVLSDAALIGGEIGAATAIRFNPDGTITAVAEPTRRGGGSAMVVEGMK